jgi:methyl-accepting chemotaxis protein
MTFEYRILAMSTWLATALAVAGPVVLWVAVASGGTTVDAGTLIATLGGVVLMPAWLLLRLHLDPKGGWVHRHSLLLNVAQLAVFFVVATYDSKLFGGYLSAVWAYFFPLIMLAAVQLPAVLAGAYGLLCTASYLVTTIEAGNMKVTDTGTVLNAAAALLITAGFSVALTKVLWHLHDDAEARRSALQDEVTELSTVLASVARGELQPSGLGAERRRVADAAVGQVWDSLDGTLASLRRVVERVQLAGQSLTGSTSALNAAATQAASSHAQQSAAIAQTTSSMQELAATASQIAEIAEAVTDAANDVTAAAEAARQIVDSAGGQMTVIVERVESIAGEALELDVSGAEIDRILRVIDELADQTNLLALNAAIEAARAGEHGRGFAVVAAEVRKLAERAQESTGQIQGIVTRIRTGTRATVMATEQGAQAAREGSAMAESVRVTLDQIVSVAGRAVTSASQIGMATRQQTSASQQVVAAMTEVALVAQTQAKGQLDRAREVEAIDGMAEDLRASIEVFHTA